MNIIVLPERQSRTHLHMVSTSMPENPKALSPSTHTILRPFSPLLLSSVAAAIAKPRPTPIVPNVPASNLTGQAEPQNNDCITQPYHMTASPPARASRTPFLLLHGLWGVFTLLHLIPPKQLEETTTGLANPNEDWVIGLFSCVFGMFA